jgi:hypothetical protein
VGSKNAPIKKIGNATINKLWSTSKNTARIKVIMRGMYIKKIKNIFKTLFDLVFLYTFNALYELKSKIMIANTITKTGPHGI